MRAAQKDTGTFEYWTGDLRPKVGMDDPVELPRNVASLTDQYSDAALREFGLYRVIPAEVPPGKIIVSFADAPIDVGGVPHEDVVLADAPPPPPYTLYRSVLIDRMEPDEATILEAALQSPDTPSKMRLLFNSVEYFVSDDPLFAILYWTIWQSLVPTLGDAAAEARADALLAPVAS